VLPQDGYAVQIQRDTGMWEWGEYSSFSVGPESDKYRLSVSFRVAWWRSSDERPASVLRSEEDRRRRIVRVNRDEYRLSVSGFSGDVGDALAGHSNPSRIGDGMQFSTPDRDNDMVSSHCAGSGNGNGWWHNVCSRSVLNYNSKAYWDAQSNLIIANIQYARMLVKFD